MAIVSRVGDRVDIECETAAEFVSVLDPLTGPFAQPSTIPAYVFRGVGSESYSLLPSAFRSDRHLLRYRKWRTPPLSTIREQCAAELETLRRFFEIAAAQGIRLPEDSQLLRSRLDRWRDIFLGTIRGAGERWPPSEFLSLIALAQHYGVATRALDWTWNPLVAAYFAAASATKAGSFLVVWVFMYFAKHIDKVLEPEMAEDQPLVLFTAPGADNDNLRAQKGIFMLQTDSVIDNERPFSAMPYDESLYEVTAAKAFPVVQRVLAPIDQATAILAQLALAGVSAASLFPGLWGAARELEEQRLIAAADLRPLKTDLTTAIRSEVSRVWRGA